MATNLYTTKTAALKATKADINNINVKKLFLGGENILDIIKNATPTIKHAQDTRESVYAKDLWGQWIETKSDGTIVVHDEVTNPNASSGAWLSNVTKVKNNKAYNGNTVLANIQTEMIKDGSRMFYENSLTSFSGDLSNLVNGYFMFFSTSLASFNGDLSNLVSGQQMFSAAKLTSFNGDLSSLVTGDNMFTSSSLASFNGDLSSLVSGDNMFDHTKLTSFTADLSNLVCANFMFYYTPITSFTSDLSSLVMGNYMFQSAAKLTPESVMHIVDSIRNLKEEKAKYTSGEIPWVTKDDTTGEYSKHFGFMENGNYVLTYNKPQPHTTYISASNVGLLTLGIDVTDNYRTIEQQLQTFAEGCLCHSWEELKQEFVDKGWTVTFQYGGTIDKIPYGFREGEQIIPCPIFAKLVESDKDSAEYCTEDASTFYNIEWGHDVTDTSSYTQFNSLEDAMASWNVFPKENIITTEE